MFIFDSKGAITQDPEITRSVRRLLGERRAAGAAILVSTHNLDEAERLADRIAVLQGRLLALDRPATLGHRLTTGRVIVRVNGRAAAFVDAARAFDARASAEGATLVVTIEGSDRATPELVRALVGAGAEILEVRPEYRRSKTYTCVWSATIPEALRHARDNKRMGTLFKKEVLDLARNRAALVPVAVVAGHFLLLPFVIAIVVPAMTGHRLADDSDLVRVSGLTDVQEPLSAEGRVQLFLFQQVLDALSARADHRRDGALPPMRLWEKNRRAPLEPLLATPDHHLRTARAKVLGAFIPRCRSPSWAWRCISASSPCSPSRADRAMVSGADAGRSLARRPAAASCRCSQPSSCRPRRQRPAHGASSSAC